MKAGYLIIIFAAFTAACTPRFYPPRVSVPDDYIYGRGFSEDTTRFGPEWWTLCSTTSSHGRWTTTATWPWRPRAWRKRG